MPLDQGPRDAGASSSSECSARERLALKDEYLYGGSRLLANDVHNSKKGVLPASTCLINNAFDIFARTVAARRLLENVATHFGDLTAVTSPLTSLCHRLQRVGFGGHASWISPKIFSWRREELDRVCIE